MDFNDNKYHITKKIINKYIKSNFTYSSEDDISEIILRVVDNYNKFNIKKGSYSNWVINISKNYMIDKFRKKNDISYVINNPDEKIENNNYEEIKISYDSKIVYDYLSTTLSSEDLSMLYMKYVDGYCYKEIGEIFNITSSTVSNKINYIKTKLKKNKGTKSLIY